MHSYVRSLESRIKDLENNMASTPKLPTPMTNQEHSFNGSVQDTTLDHDDIILLDQPAVDCNSFDINDTGWGIRGTPSEHSSTYAQPDRVFSMDVELKKLSLEAVAERHLGSTSGVSFAKLTQTVLRRLSPDKADFVFSKQNDAETQQELNFGSISNLLNGPMSLNLGGSMLCDPMLFGDFPLFSIADTEDELVHLLIPSDDHKIDRLVGFYFAHSHTLYPIIHRAEFTTMLHFVRENPQATSGQSPLSLFRIWMVLAIGSTAYCSVSLADESESMLYYSKAMMYFEACLGYGDMVC